jgi:hypothetical protein
MVQPADSHDVFADYDGKREQAKLGLKAHQATIYRESHLFA